MEFHNEPLESVILPVNLNASSGNLLVRPSCYVDIEHTANMIS